MGELSDRLRAAAEGLNDCPAYAYEVMSEAAAELDRLGELLGPAAYSTDERWAHSLTARAQAEAALVAAAGYWERVLAADLVPRYTRPAKVWP